MPETDIPNAFEKSILKRFSNKQTVKNLNTFCMLSVIKKILRGNFITKFAYFNSLHN
jgi:hypothetical protein